MARINENKLFNELLRDMNNYDNFLDFLKLVKTKYGMSEQEFKDSGLYKVWCKEKHDRPEYFPDEPDPINENTIRKAVREALQEFFS